MDWLEKKIDTIVKDRRHGAVQLASIAIRILIDVCKRSDNDDPESLLSLIKKTAISLSEARPSMAPIRNWCLVFAHRFQESCRGGASVQEAKLDGLMVGEELLSEQERFIQRQVQAARPLLSHCTSLITLSYSSTVEAILRHSLPSRCRVIIAESRPLMEGRKLFRRVLANVADLRMITDAQLGLVIPDADFVLVGADTILRDLAVVNKTGTYLAALVAHTHSREFFVAADTYKINATMDSQNCVLEAKSGREVWASQESQCDNVYFDLTPGCLISGFVSEAGILDLAGMQAQVQRWEQLAREISLRV
jgi:translation initiation factor eIF-2B subunit delta